MELDENGNPVAPQIVEGSVAPVADAPQEASAPVAVEAVPEVTPETVPVETPFLAQFQQLMTAIASLDERLKAVEANAVSHSHGIPPEIVQHIAGEAKDATVAHLKAQITGRLASLVFGNVQG